MYIHDRVERTKQNLKIIFIVPDQSIIKERSNIWRFYNHIIDIHVCMHCATNLHSNTKIHFVETSRVVHSFQITSPWGYSIMYIIRRQKNRLSSSTHGSDNLIQLCASGSFSYINSHTYLCYVTQLWILMYIHMSLAEEEALLALKEACFFSK